MTHEDFHALVVIENGAYIYSMVHALNLREIHKQSPKLLRITDAVDESRPGYERQPYFRAILTNAGRLACERYLRARRRKK